MAAFLKLKCRISRLKNVSSGFWELGANTGGFRNRTGRQQSSGFVNGEIIAKDDKSITLKLRDGGSKIVFFSDSTEITKTAKGLVDDLRTGQQIVVNGNQNPDGSVTAETIQLR